MKKYKTGLIIGRFQPLHKGHLYLIKEGLKLADKIMIGIGSANVSDTDNPYSVTQRIQMLEKALHKEIQTGHIIKIVSLDDNQSDSVWLDVLLKKTGKFDVVIGNNERVKGIMEHAGYPVEPVQYYKREIYEGRKIREKLRRKKLL